MESTVSMVEQPSGVSRRLFLKLVPATALLLAACGGAAAPASPSGAPSSAKSDIPTFAQVLAAAKQEGTIELWTGRPDIQAAWQEAFNKRFGTDIKVTGSDLQAGVAATRLITEARGGKPSADLLQPSYDIALDLEERKLMPDPYPWVEVFGGELPTLKDSMDHIKVPQFKNRVPTMRDVMYHGVYRTDQIKKEDLPKTFEALADAKYKGQFAFDTKGSPLEYLIIVPGWTEERILDLAAKIKANAPRFFAGTNAIRDAVVNGQAAFSTAGDAIAAKQQGRPVDNFYLEPLAINTLLATVPKTAPHPNAARLFAAWVSVEGPKALEERKIDYHEDLWQKDLLTTKMLYESLPNVTPYYFEKPEQVSASQAMRGKLSDLMTGAR